MHTYIVRSSAIDAATDIEIINDNHYHLQMTDRRDSSQRQSRQNLGNFRDSLEIATSRVSSKTLLGARGELIIEHGGREYRLRQTSTGKLILTA